MWAKGVMGRGFVAAVLVVVAAAAAIALFNSAPVRADVVGTPGAAFACNPGEDFLSQGNPAQLYFETDTGGGASYTPLGAASAGYNALGYDTANNYLYAMSDFGGPARGTSELVQIDASGNVTPVGVITLPNLDNNEPNTGAFDATGSGDAGDYYVTETGDSDMWVINPATAKVISTIGLSSAWLPSDWAFSGGFLFGAIGGASAGTTDIYEVNPANGTTYGPFSVAGQGGDPAGATFGAAWTYGNGNLGFGANQSGDINEYSVSNPGPDPTFGLVQAYTTSFASGQNDGAACPGPAVDLTIAKTVTATYQGVTSTGTTENSDEGGALTYTLTVTNNSTTAISSGDGVTDVVPSDVTKVKTSTPGCSVSGNTVSCNQGQIAPGKSATITITGTAPSSATTFANSAVVTPQQQETGNPDSNTVNVTTVAPDADVSISKQVTAINGNAGLAGLPTENPTQSVAPGQTISYKVTVPNGGPQPAANTVVTDALPAGTSLDGTVTWGGAAAAGCSATSTSCTIGTLASGSTVTESYTLSVPSSYAATTVVNTGSVSTTSPNNGTPLSDTDTVKVAAVANVSISKKVTAINGNAGLAGLPTENPTETVAPGQTISYTVTVPNTGPSDAQGVAVTDALPAGTSLDGAVTWGGAAAAGCSATSTTCTIGTLPSGSTVTESYTLSVPANYAPATVVNTGTVSTTTTNNGTPTSDTDTVNVAAIASVSISKKVTAINGNAGLADLPTENPTETVAPGQTISYTVTVPNTGPSDAQGVAVTDALPAGTTLDGTVTWGGPAAAGCSAISTSCTIGTLPSGGTVTESYTLAVASSYAAATVVNTGAVSTTTTNTGTPTSDTDTVNVAAVASVSISKVVTQIDGQTDPDLPSANPSEPVFAGQTVQYQLAVTNGGPSDAQNVVVGDPLPADTTLAGAVAWTGAGAAGCSTTAVSCTLTLPAGGTLTATYTLQVPSSYVAATINNTATVSTSTTNTGGPTSASATVQVQSEAQMTITKTATAQSGSTTQAIAGQTVAYTVTVTNPGPSDAQNVTVSDDPLPANTTLDGSVTWSDASCSTTSTSCTVGTLPAGASITESFTVLVASSDTSSPVTNTAIATTTTQDTAAGATEPTAGTWEVQASKSLQLLTQAAMTITKTATPPADGGGEAVAGENVGYTVTVTNPGPSDAQDVNVTDPLQPYMTLVAGSVTWTGTGVSTAGCATTSTTCAIGTLPAGATVTLTFSVTIASNYDDTADGVQNTGTATTTTDDTDPSATEPAAGTWQVQASANLALTTYSQLTFSKATQAVGGGAAPDPVVAGNSLDWVITIGNNGPSYAYGVTVTDNLPSYLLNATIVSATEAGGGDPTCSVAGQVLSCTPGTIGTGAGLITITFETQVDPAYDDTTDGVFNGGVTTGPAADQTTACAASTNPEPGTPANVCGSAHDDLTTDADLVITETYAQTSFTPDTPPTSAVAGTKETFTLTVANNGPSYAQAATVTDTVPADTTIISVSAADPSQTCTPGTGVASDTFSCSLGTLSLGADVSTITLVVSINPADTAATITNSAAVASPTPDPNLANNSTAPPVPLVTLADLTLGETYAQTTYTPDSATTDAVAGTDETFTFTVGNLGPSYAQNGSLLVTMPADTSFVSGTVVGPSALGPLAESAGSHAEFVGSNAVEPDAVPSLDPCTAGPASGQVTCSLGTLALGTGISKIAIVVHIGSDDLAPNIVDAGYVSSTTTDPNLMNNSASVTVPLVQIADLAFQKVPGTGPYISGTDTSYDLITTNNGPSDAQAVTTADTIPQGETYVGYTIVSGPADTTCTDSGSAFSCTTATLTDASVLDIRLTVLIASSVTGNLTNTGSVMSTTHDPNPGNNTGTTTITTTQEADVAITKTPLTSPLVPGEQGAYVLSAANNGPSDAQGVAISDPLPQGMTYVSYTSPNNLNCSYDSTTNTFSCAVGTLVVGTTVQVQVTVSVASSVTGNVVNTATVTSSTPDPDPGNNGSTATVPSAPESQVTVVKTAATPTVQVDTDESYTLTATNAGPSDAKDVVITDPLPKGLKFVSASPGCKYSKGVVTCTVASLSAVAGQNVASFKLTVYVETDVASEIVNTATVTTKTQAPSGSVPSGSVPTGGVPVGRKSTARVKALFPKLRLVKTANHKVVKNGGDVTYTLKLSNIGKATAHHVEVCDQLPAGTVIVSAHGSRMVDGQACWSIKLLRAGHSLTKKITLMMAASTLHGPVVNRATASATGIPKAVAKSKVTVTNPPPTPPEGVTG
jgi:uncharacterized repeat protein (TIGR01451 family)